MKTATSKRLRRSATAYRRLMWKRGLTEYQVNHYRKLAERLERQAEREEAR